MGDDLDDAVHTAATRASEAEERLIEKPIESPEIVVEAYTVEHRVEDLDVLAQDAAREAAPDE